MTYVELSVKLQYNMQFYFWSHPCFSSGVGEEISRGGREVPCFDSPLRLD